MTTSDLSSSPAFPAGTSASLSEVDSAAPASATSTTPAEGAKTITAADLSDEGHRYLGSVVARLSQSGNAYDVRELMKHFLAGITSSLTSPSASVRSQTQKYINP